LITPDQLGHGIVVGYHWCVEEGQTFARQNVKICNDLAAQHIGGQEAGQNCFTFASWDWGLYYSPGSVP